MNVTVIPSIWRTRNSPEGLQKETGGIGNQGKKLDHTDHNMVKIVKNTKKNPGDWSNLLLLRLQWQWCEKLVKSGIIINWIVCVNKVNKRKNPCLYNSIKRIVLAGRWTCYLDIKCNISNGYSEKSSTRNWSNETKKVSPFILRYSFLNSRKESQIK